MTLRGGVKLQAVSLPSAPLPWHHYKARTTELPLVAQGAKRVQQSTRALHYDYDYNDHSERANKIKETTGGLGDYDDRSCYYEGSSLCV